MKNVFFACVVGVIGLLIAESEKKVDSAPLVPTVVDVDSPVDSPLESPAEAPPIEPWKDCVFRVRQKDGRGTAGGTAVSLGDGLLVTAAHVLQANTQPEVNVNGKWVPAGFNRVQGQDVAYLTINDTSLPGVPVRQPVAGECVTIYGMTTRLPWQGELTGNVSTKGMWQVKLNTELEGTESGDSGAGVFGEDGALLLIHALHSSSGDTWGTPLNPPAPYATSQQPASNPTTRAPVIPPATPSNSVAQSPVCSGGTCSMSASRPKRFRIFRR